MFLVVFNKFFYNKLYNKQLLLYQTLLFISFLTLIISMTFKISGTVFEMTRFFYVGNYFLIYLGIILFLSMEKVSSNYRIVIKFLMLLSTIPVFIYFLFYINNNMFGKYTFTNKQYKKVATINERIDLLRNSNQIIGKEYNEY